MIAVILLENVAMHVHQSYLMQKITYGEAVYEQVQI